MKGSWFSEEQIIGVLREHEAGSKTEEVCRRHGIRARHCTSGNLNTAARRYRRPAASSRSRTRTGA